MKTKVTLEVETDGEHTPEQVRQAVAEWFELMEKGDFMLWLHNSDDPNDAEEIDATRITVIK